MDLSKLKVGDCIKKKNKDFYFCVAEITDKDILLEKLEPRDRENIPHWTKLDSPLFSDFEIISSIPEKYLPF